MLQFSINKFNRFVLTLPGRHDLVSTLKRRRMSTGFKREPKKWSNTLKQFVGYCRIEIDIAHTLFNPFHVNIPNYLNVFQYFALFPHTKVF